MSNEAVVLQVEARDVTGKKVKALRRGGKIPAVIYERGKESVNVLADHLELARVWSRAGKHHTVTLKLDGKDHLTMIKDATIDPVKRTLNHVAFHAINRNEKVEAEIPIHLVGNAPASQQGLIVHQTLDTITVEGLPGNLPDSFEVDISGLETPEDHIRVNALTIPSDMTLLTDLEQMVVSVIVPRAEVEAEAEEEAAEGEEGAEEVPSEHGGDKPEADGDAAPKE